MTGRTGIIRKGSIGPLVRLGCCKRMGTRLAAAGIRRDKPWAREICERRIGAHLSRDTESSFYTALKLTAVAQEASGHNHKKVNTLSGNHF